MLPLAGLALGALGGGGGGMSLPSQTTSSEASNSFGGFTNSWSSAFNVGRGASSAQGSAAQDNTMLYILAGLAGLAMLAMLMKR